MELIFWHAWGWKIFSEPQTCLMPWKAQSQKSSSAQRNDAWNTESNILGTQLFTRKLSGNSGSVEHEHEQYHYSTVQNMLSSWVNWELKNNFQSQKKNSVFSLKVPFSLWVCIQFYLASQCLANPKFKHQFPLYFYKSKNQIQWSYCLVF